MRVKDARNTKEKAQMLLDILWFASWNNRHFVYYEFSSYFKICKYLTIFKQTTFQYLGSNRNDIKVTKYIKQTNCC